MTPKFHAAINPCWRSAERIAVTAARASVSITLPAEGVGNGVSARSDDLLAADFDSLAAQCPQFPNAPRDTPLQARSTGRMRPILRSASRTASQRRSCRRGNWRGPPSRRMGKRRRCSRTQVAGAAGGAARGGSSTAAATTRSSACSASLWNSSFWACPGSMNGRARRCVALIMLSPKQARWSASPRAIRQSRRSD